MLVRCLLAVFLCSLAWGQTPNPASGQKPAPAPAAKPGAPAPALESFPPKVEPLTASSPVITIAGLCAKPSSAQTLSDPTCATVITKEQFDKLADAINPQMPIASRRQLANQWAQSMVLSSVAQTRGVDTNPVNADVIQLERMRVLSQLLLRDLQAEAAKVPQPELEKYYNEHPDAFEEATLKRLFIPKNRPEAKAQLDEAGLKAEADKIRVRAAAGEDLEKLEKELYQADGIKGDPPPVNLNGVRREALPPSQAAVFNLKPGEISQPMAEASGYYIVQMVSKQSLPLDAAKSDIVRALTQTRMQQLIQGIAGNFKPTFNEAYFNAGAFGAAAGQEGMPKPTLGPPAKPETEGAKPQPK